MQNRNYNTRTAKSPPGEGGLSEPKEAFMSAITMASSRESVNPEFARGSK